VFVLAGGLGTRLAGLHPDRPKALVPVAGRPFIEHQLEWLADHDLTDVVLCAGHGAESLTAHVGDGAPFGVRVEAVIEDRPRGTAGALAGALARTAQDGTFFVVNGDTLAEFDRVAMLALHHRLDADATLACFRVDEVSARGTVDPGTDGRLAGFREKASSGPGWVSGGVYVLEPRALAGVDPDSTAPASLEQDVFPSLLAAGRTLAAWQARGRFWDMGTPEGLAEAQTFLERRQKDGPDA
jgi:NDP-sugar pyrophosphorylase family protein